MKVSVDFYEAPDTSEWVAHLADEGWKVTQLTADRFRCEKARGNSANFPPRQSLRWYLEVAEKDTNSGVVVTASVPVFSENLYARDRLLGEIESIADNLCGECRTERDFTTDLLGALRDGEL